MKGRSKGIPFGTGGRWSAASKPLKLRCDCPRQSLDYKFAARSTTPRGRWHGERRDGEGISQVSILHTPSRMCHSERNEVESKNLFNKVVTEMWRKILRLAMLAQDDTGGGWCAATKAPLEGSWQDVVLTERCCRTIRPLPDCNLVDTSQLRCAQQLPSRGALERPSLSF